MPGTFDDISSILIFLRCIELTDKKVKLLAQGTQAIKTQSVDFRILKLICLNIFYVAKFIRLYSKLLICV